LKKAEQHVLDGADFLDVGGVKAGPGPEVTPQEELDRVIPAIERCGPGSTYRCRSTRFGPRWLAPRIAPVPTSATTSAALPIPTSCPPHTNTAPRS
jgi:hypothetical protein